MCAFKGAGDVVYGANDRWTQPQRFTDGVSCTNATFGDPISGVLKSCRVRVTSSAGLSKAQALAALGTNAQGKVDAATLDHLLDNPDAELIVSYGPSRSVAFSAEKSSHYASELQSAKVEMQALKQQALGTLPSVTLAQDYDALPMNMVRIRQREDLVQLLNHHAVEAVYENVAHHPVLAQSLPLIQQPQAAAAGHRGAGTTVAVLDTGVDFRRAAFGSCSAPGVPASCAVSAAVEIAPDDGQLDAHGHGTHVAATVLGVAPGARVVALDVFSGGSAMTNDIINGINWVINNRAVHNIVALNLSLGDKSRNPTECTRSWAMTPFARARAVGIAPVVASGNEGFSDALSSPACARGAVRVGAVDDTDQVASFSNNSTALTLLAPGVSITAAGVTMSGTSMAAPHVSGAVAVARAADVAAGETVDQTVARLVNAGMPVRDARTGLVKPRLNLFNATTPPRTGPCSYAAPGSACKLDVMAYDTDLTQFREETVIAYGRMWTYDTAGNVRQNAVDLRSIPRYANGPCSRAPANQPCVIDTLTILNHPDHGYIESVSAYGYAWNFWRDGSEIANASNFDLKTIPRYGTGGPVFGGSNPTPCGPSGNQACKFDTRELVDARDKWGDIFESISAYGSYFIFRWDGTFLESRPLLSVTRYAAGPCQHRPSGAQCSFDTSEKKRVNGKIIEVITAYGRYWEFEDGSDTPLPGSGVELKDVARFR